MDASPQRRSDVLGYVPETLVDLLDSWPLEPGACRRFDAVTLLADVAGSTTVGEALAGQGSIGAEALGAALNAHIGAVVDLVRAHGGQVAKFTGDGLLALWPGERSRWPECIERASRCAHAIQQHLPRADGTRVLPLRLAIGCGEVSLMLVPTEAEHLEPLFSGPAVRESAAACSAASTTQVALTATVRERLGTAPGGAAAADLPSLLVAPPRRLPRHAGVDAALRRLVPPVVLAAVDAGQGEWVAQLRSVTALFVGAPTPASGELATPDVLAFAGIVEAAVRRHGGVVARIGYDDKGLAILAAFGMSARTHEDDPARAVGASLEIAAELRSQGRTASLGVATGRVFTGALGTAAAGELTVIGDAVNVAARLMQSASADVWCDAVTEARCRDRFAFTRLEAVHVKGRRETVQPFRPQHRLGAGRPRHLPMIGRTAELRGLEDALDALVRDGTASALVVDGEPGIGKSTLLAAAAERARARAVRVVMVSGDPLEAGVPLHPWSQLLRQVLRVDRGESIPRWLTPPHAGRPIEAPAAESWWRSREALVQSLLGHEVDAPTWEADALAAASQDVVLRMLDAASRRERLLLVLDDLHWFDSSSLTLVRLAAERIRGMMLLAATRPAEGAMDPEAGAALVRAGFRRVTLGPLPAGEAEALARRSLDVGGRADPVVAMVLERCHGHPLFIDELAQSLGRASLGESPATAADSSWRPIGAPWIDEPPPTVDALISARIDRLPPAQPLLLRVDSVVGTHFSLTTLAAVFPGPAAVSALAADARALCEVGMLVDRGDGRELEFRHALTRDAAYATILHEQRRELHESVARWLEARSAEEAVPPARLAYHWGEVAQRRPDCIGKALVHLERAGEMASQRNAYREAAEYFGRAIAFVDGSRGSHGVELYRRMRWERLLGEACFGLGELDRARHHLRRALELSPVGHPPSRGAMVLELGRGVAEQLARRTLPTSGRGDVAGGHEVLVEAASAYNFLQIIAFIEMDRLAAVHAAVRAVNLAERAGPSRPLVYALGGAGLLAGAVSRRAAERYHELALDRAAVLGDRLATLGPWFARGYLHMRPGEWTAADAAFARAQELAEEFGDRRFWEMCEMQRGCILFSRGAFPACLERYHAAARSAQRRGDADAQALALVGVATALVRLGRITEGLDEIERLRRWLGPELAEIKDRGIRINALGTWALLLWRHHSAAEAAAAARFAGHWIAVSPVLAHYALPGYANTAEVALAMAEQGEADAWLLATAARGLQRFRLAFPFARPQQLLCHGSRALLRCRRRHPLRAWQAGLRSAQRLGMQYEQGLLHLGLAELGVDDAGEHRDRARSLLVASGAVGEVERAEGVERRLRGAC